MIVTRSEMQINERKAIELEQRGQPSAALEVWRYLARECPSAVFHCRAGGILQSLGEFSEAESAYRAANKLNPLLPEAYLGLALSLITQNRPEDALEALDSAPKCEDQALVLSLRGHALKELGRTEKALEAFREATGIDPGFDEAFLNIGLLLKGIDDEGAEVAFRKVVDLDDGCAEAHRELGWIERKSERLSSAELHLRRATELNPHDTWAWVYLGNLFWRSGRSSDAESAFRNAYERAPNEWYPNWELACFYEDGGENEKAARFYHKALQASSSEPVLLFHYGRFLLRQGDRVGAERFLRHACEVDPGYDKPRQLLHEIAGSRAGEEDR